MIAEAGSGSLTLPPRVEVPAQGSHLVLLGTMAGPVLHPSRMMSGQAVVVDGVPYLIDCGYGTIERMTRAGLSPAQLGAIFITHHHSDHTADYPALTHLAWIQGIGGVLPVFGPPPLQRLHDAALACNAEDAAIRIAATGRQPVGDHFQVTEIVAGGEIFRDARVTVRAALVDHPPFAHAFAFRIDTLGRSFVISGDTTPSEALVELARGADVLVHEAMYVPAIDRMLAARAYVPPKLRSFLLEGHSSAEDCGRIAAQAGVGTLVLSHLLPGDDAGVPDEVWHAEAAKTFGGQILVGHDLLVV
jgi:ribonuclease BN (tRNA processing enzyme)